MNVLIARNLLLPMEMPKESIVATPVLWRISLVVMQMSEEQFRREKMYLATMHQAKNLLKQSIITQEQYKQIDTIFAKKYGISLSTLCS